MKQIAKLSKTKSFSYTSTTDGRSINFLFEPKNDFDLRKKNTRYAKKKKEDSEVQTTSEQINAEVTNNSTVAEQVKPKPTKAKKDTKPAQLNECLNIEDLTESEKNKYKKYHLIGVDPGPENLVFLADEDGKKLRYTAKQRYVESRARLSKRKLLKMKAATVIPSEFEDLLTKIYNNVPLLDIPKVEEILSTCNSKTVNFDEYLGHLELKSFFKEQLFTFYQMKTFRNMRLQRYIYKRKSIDNFINKIKAKFNPDGSKKLLLLHGHWSSSAGMKGRAPTMGIELRRILSRHFNVLIVNEQYSSKMCCNCGGEHSKIPLSELEELNKKSAINNIQNVQIFKNEKENQNSLHKKRKRQKQKKRKKRKKRKKEEEEFEAMAVANFTMDQNNVKEKERLRKTLKHFKKNGFTVEDFKKLPKQYHFTRLNVQSKSANCRERKKKQRDDAQQQAQDSNDKVNAGTEITIKQVNAQPADKSNETTKKDNQNVFRVLKCGQCVSSESKKTTFHTSKDMYFSQESRDALIGTKVFYKNRDLNAAQNIRQIGLSILFFNKRPFGFSRTDHEKN